MKKKSQRVPDFSTKRPGAKPGAIAPGSKAKPAPPVPTIKPQATSSKSGHRGG